MNILIVAHGVPDQSVLGGPGRVAAAHARALAARGHHVRVLTSDIVVKGASAEPTFGLLGPDIEARWVRARTLKWWPGTVGPVLSRTSGTVRSALSGVDVLHCHEWPHGLVQGARRAAKRAGVPCVVQPHGSIQARTGLNRLLHAATDALHPLGPQDVVLVGSDHEEAEVLQAARHRPVVRHLVNPMAASKLDKGDPAVAARRRSWMLPAGAKALLYAHRLAPNKGLDLAIAALAQLPDSCHLIVIGDDSVFPTFVKECHTLVAKLSLGQRVRFEGTVDGREIDEVLLAADLFLLPARRDTFPLMVLHALACGVPAVVTDTCQSVDQLAGAVVAVRPTADALAAGISSVDDATGSELAANGRELLMAKFSPESVAAQLEEIYLTAARVSVADK